MYKSPAYLQNAVGLEGSNQATDYLRYQDEIAKQRAQLEARRRHNSSFGQRAVRGLGGALKGGLMGAMTMNPWAAAGGAAAGFAGGALDDGNGGAGATIGQNIGALGAMGSMAAGRYLGGGDSPGFSQGDVNSEFNLGNLNDEDLRMLRAQGKY
jgi:hypothetical protein